MSLTHGNDPERLRSISDALQQQGRTLGDLGRTGTMMLSVLEDAWAGPDLEGYQQSWSVAAQLTDSAAGLLEAFARLAREQADEQVRSSGVGGSGASPFAGARASGTARAGLGFNPAGLQNFFSWDDVEEFWGKTKNSIGSFTDGLNDWWKDNIGDSWLGRQAQLRLAQGGYWAGELADWLRSPEGRWVPLSPSIAFITDMAGDTLDDWSKYINDPKGTFMDDWEDAGLFGKVLAVASVFPIARLLKKPADELDDLGRKLLRKDPPGWKGDFTERAANKGSSDPREAAQARLNERANRYVERYDLEDPEDVWDQGKIDPRRRGIIVEAAHDGNLPGSFRTWDKIEQRADGGQVATSIKSIDPSAPSYATGNGVENTLKGYVNDIDNATTQNRGGVSIDPDDLDAKVLEIVTPPGGFDAGQLEQLHRVREYADSKGVDIVVKEYP